MVVVPARFKVTVWCIGLILGIIHPQGQAFCPKIASKSSTVGCKPPPQVWPLQSRSGEDKNRAQEGDDTLSSVQESMNEIVLGTGESNDSEAAEMTAYNAVPLFTGGIVTLFSVAFTAYLYYVGLTGDDPLMGHPK